jgi:SAM-dependent MidA family methyltransferase
LVERIRRDGPLRFDEFHAAALYDTRDGFFASGGQAGRRGDFLTSPEVGPLLGAVVARAIDAWWEALGQPNPFVFVDAGAGPGTLARSVLHAGPACRASGALRYVAVEVSAAQRALHPVGESGFESRAEQRAVDPHTSPGVASVAELPAGSFDGVIIANELLDDLPFRLLVFDGGWREAFVDLTADGRFVEVLAPLDDAPPFALPVDVPHGARIPWQERAGWWLADALGRLSAGRIVVIDYCSDTARLAQRPWREWLRTYRGHERGGHYLADPGGQDITAEVALDQLAAAVRLPDAVRTQAQWLALHGIAELVDEGRRAWEAGAARADLVALEGRSRIREAEALTDPSGLGAFTVAEWLVPGPATRSRPH